MAPCKPTWLAETILAEDGGRYLIQWAGVDQAGEAWKPTWEPRANANAALVSAWREENELKPVVPKLEAKAEEIETKLHLARAVEREAGPELPPDLPLDSHLPKLELKEEEDVKPHLAESQAPNADLHDPTVAAPSFSVFRSREFPPEVLYHILSFVSDSYFGNHFTIMNERNVDLASLALVSRAFQAATYSVLYGDLGLAWMADKVRRLRKSFKSNPNLLPLVRRLEATAVHQDEWIEYQLATASDDDADDSSKAWSEAYYDRHDIDENSQEWLLMEDAAREDGEERGQWEEDVRSDAKDAWVRKGYGAWKGKGNSEGALQLLDIIASAPTLRILVVRDFTRRLHPRDIATRGPYPLIAALEASTYRTSSFFIDHTLPSILASSTPNLRSLSGNIGYRGGGAPIISLPPSLTRLRIEGYNGDTQIDTLLLQTQPSLRSLTLVGPKPGWASSPALVALLSSLETFTVEYHHPLAEYSGEIDSLALALAPSSSLRHLEVVPATATLLAALPLSLQSIALLPVKNTTEDPREDMKRVLELMKVAATHPLRVEFLAASRSEGEVAWEECRDAYAVEGHVLSVRYYWRI